MDIARLESEMKRLWKVTFHDSDKYVDLLFAHYFNPRYIEYEENGEGRLTASMLGIPYNLTFNGHIAKGIYLCGLATEKTERRRGLMSRMIERMAERMEKEGFAFLFLIPSDEHLRQYYLMRGFQDAFYKADAVYPAMCPLESDYINAVPEMDDSLMKERYLSLTCERFAWGVPDEISRDEIVEFVRNQEAESQIPCIAHSAEDLAVAIDENAISGGSIYVCRDNKSRISALAFVYDSAEDGAEIYSLLYSDECGCYRLLDFIKNDFGRGAVHLYVPVECIRNLPELRGNIKPYGMVRILNFSEILKFLTGEIDCAEYSILRKSSLNWSMSLMLD